MNNIEDILDILDDLIEEAWSLPFSGGRCVVDAEKVRELMADIRLNMPAEIKQAKMIVADRGEIIGVARKEADAIVRKAEDRAKALVAQEEIVKQAQAKAADIMQQAQAKAREMRMAAQEFSDSILKQSEEVLSESLKEIKTTRQALRTIPKN